MQNIINHPFTDFFECLITVIAKDILNFSFEFASSILILVIIYAMTLLILHNF